MTTDPSALTPTACDPIRVLMGAEDGRGLSSSEADEIATHVLGCPTCRAHLSQPEFPLPPVELPTDREWQRVEAQVLLATGHPPTPTSQFERQLARNAQPEGERDAEHQDRPRGSGAAWWTSSIWPAAAIALVSFGLWFGHRIPTEGVGAPAAFTAEILNVPEGSETLILALEEEAGGGVLIYISG